MNFHYKITGLLCTLSLIANKLNKQTTLTMSDELAQRRQQAGIAPTAA